MTDYIKREDAYRRLTEYYHHTREIQHESLRIALIGIPSADVEPVRHGHWEPLGVDGWGRCSWCGCPDKKKGAVYCRHCGAKMDRGINGE